jgi:hypothetical protein
VAPQFRSLRRSNGGVGMDAALGAIRRLRQPLRRHTGNSDGKATGSNDRGNHVKDVGEAAASGRHAGTPPRVYIRVAWRAVRNNRPCRNSSLTYPRDSETTRRHADTNWTDSGGRVVRLDLWRRPLTSPHPRTMRGAGQQGGGLVSVEPTGRGRLRTVPQPTPLSVARACGCGADAAPSSVLEFHLDLRDHPDLPLASLGVGYELRAWRAAALAENIIDWVPDFALRPDERAGLEPMRLMEKLRRAYQATFGNGRSSGVPAEILLHAICREFYGSSTMVHKVVFKTADNDTYKGFDGVHCVHAEQGGLELWFGEAKFYTDLRGGLRAIADDLERHLRADYVKNEFAIVGDKLDRSHPHYEELRELLRPNQRVEMIFNRLVIPAFVTYDSPATGAHNSVTEEYLDAVRAEALEAAGYLRDRIARMKQQQLAAGDPHGDLPIQLRLFLLPMESKRHLEQEIDRRVASWLL